MLQTTETTKMDKIKHQRKAWRTQINDRIRERKNEQRRLSRLAKFAAI